MLRDSVSNVLSKLQTQAQREAINREKGRGVHTPRTVDEQVADLAPGPGGHRMRDPQKAAADQRSIDAKP